MKKSNRPELPSGSEYQHTAPLPLKRNAEWQGSWPEMKYRNATPDGNDRSWVTSPTTTLPPPDAVGAYQNNRPVAPKENAKRKAWIVGGGIAGLSAAFYLLRDGGFKGENITFLEDESFMGGALDAFGNAEEGYRARGGRELTWNHQNIWEMFSEIPSPDLPGYSLLDEFRFTNDYSPAYSRARILHKRGEIADFSGFGLTPAQRKKLAELEMMPIEKAYDLTIADYFDADFLKTNFWLYWKTQFGFGDEAHQSLLQVKLYMHRFPEGLPGMNNLSCMKSSKRNQFDNWVKPIWDFLSQKGVSVRYNTLVRDIIFEKKPSPEGEILTAKTLKIQNENRSEEIALHTGDVVFTTLGSLVAGTAYGTTDKGLVFPENPEKQWELWRNLAKVSPVFGNPEKACGHTDYSGWMTWCATLPMSSPIVRKIAKDYGLCQPESGESVTGGIISIRDSNWKISFTVERQPFFPNQPKDICVIWGDALEMKQPGNHIKKEMKDCTGREILTEVAYHLGLEAKETEETLKKARVNFSFMPYVIGFFMPYGKDDRPDIVPDGVTNLGLIGQFVKMQNDVSFTVESSVRTGRAAVYKLLGLSKQVPDIAPTRYDIRYFLRAARALNDYAPSDIELKLREMVKGTYFESILPPDTLTKELEDPAQCGTEKV